MAVKTDVGATDADAYVDPDMVSDYATKHGKAFVIVLNEKADAACRVATQWLDTTYRQRLPGCPASQDQALEWPRSGVWYRNVELPSDAIPNQILDAACEAAIRELAQPGSLAPDLERGGAVKSIKAGSVAIEYAGSAIPGTVFQTIEGILAALLITAPNPYIGRAARA